MTRLLVSFSFSVGFVHRGPKRQPDGPFSGCSLRLQLHGACELLANPFAVSGRVRSVITPVWRARAAMALSKLSGDEQGIRFVKLCNVLDPRLAVALDDSEDGEEDD